MNDSPNTADTDIDTELYLRDGAPHATVCKVQMKDGRIGIGVCRPDLSGLPSSQSAYDALALTTKPTTSPVPKLQKPTSICRHRSANRSTDDKANSLPRLRWRHQQL
jgi:hypothetical protein